MYGSAARSNTEKKVSLSKMRACTTTFLNLKNSIDVNPKELQLSKLQLDLNTPKLHCAIEFNFL